LNISPGCGDDFDPAIGILGPLNRHVEDPVAGFLGDCQQLSIKKPTIIFYDREQTLSSLFGYGFKAALRIGEVCRESKANQPIIAPRDYFPVQASLCNGARTKAGPDGQIELTGRQRPNHRRECIQASGQIDIHVAENVRSGLSPSPFYRSPATLFLQANHASHRLGSLPVCDQLNHCSQ